MKYLKNKFFYIAILTIISFSCVSSKEKEDSITVMAYYVPEKDYKPEALPLDQLTHIIFSFTKVIDNEMKFNNNENDIKLKKLVEQRKKHPDLKVMIACGGWGSKGFTLRSQGPSLFWVTNSMLFSVHQVVW